MGAYTPLYAARLLTESRNSEEIKALLKAGRLKLYDPAMQQPTDNARNALVDTLALAQLLADGVSLDESAERELSALAGAWKNSDEFERRLIELHKSGGARPLHLHEWFKHDTWTPREAMRLLLGLDPDHDWFALADESGIDITIVCARWLDGSLVCLDGYRNANVMQLEHELHPDSPFPGPAPTTSFDLLDLSIQLRRMVTIWNSGNHRHRNPPSYYLEWACRKGCVVAWLEWARAEGVVDSVATPVAEHVMESAPGANDDERVTESYWIIRARELAQAIGEKRWRSGQRQITARNIDEAVADELGKDRNFHGKQGPRSASNVRSVALKGWKFSPPDDVA